MQFASRRRLYFWATLVAASALAAGCSSGTATSGGGSQSSASGNYPVTAAVLHAFTVLGLVAVIAAVVLFFTDRLTGSPWGRRLRAMRDNTEAAESLGTSVRAESLKVYVIGGAIAAVSGGLLVEFIGAWSPAASATTSAPSSARSWCSARSWSCRPSCPPSAAPIPRSRCRPPPSAC